MPTSLRLQWRLVATAELHPGPEVRRRLLLTEPSRIAYGIHYGNDNRAMAPA